MVMGVVEEVLGEVENTEKKDGLIHLSTGVVLQPVPIPKLFLERVVRKFAPPPPPKVFDEARQREFENLEDPDWIAHKEQLAEDMMTALLDVMIAKGTRMYSIPDSFPKPVDASWVEEYETLVGEKVPASAVMRYLYWVKFVAIVGEEDLVALAEQVRRQLGVPDTLVADQMSTFPGDTQQLPDHGSGDQP